MDAKPTRTVRPARLADGAWGVAVEGGAQPGDRVIVVSQRGKEWTSILDEVVKPGIWRVLPIDHKIAKASKTQMDTIMRMLDYELKKVDSFETVSGTGYEVAMELLRRNNLNDLTMDEASRLMSEINGYLTQRAAKSQMTRRCSR